MRTDSARKCNRAQFQRIPRPRYGSFQARGFLSKAEIQNAAYGVNYRKKTELDPLDEGSQAVSFRLL